MGIEAWKTKWGHGKPKAVKHFEPLPHGGHILGEALAEKSTEEIRKLYARELAQTKIC